MLIGGRFGLSAGPACCEECSCLLAAQGAKRQAMPARKTLLVKMHLALCSSWMHHQTRRKVLTQHAELVYSFCFASSQPGVAEQVSGTSEGPGVVVHWHLSPDSGWALELTFILSRSICMIISVATLWWDHKDDYTAFIVSMSSFNQKVLPHLLSV